MGSENGTPSSITSAPAFTRECMTSTVASSDGSPAVTKGIRAGLRAARSRSKVASILLIVFHDGVHVLVAAAGEVHEQDLVLRHRRRDLHRVRERVARFERRDD